MKRYVVLSVGCVLFFSIAASWLRTVREVGQEWRPSREAVPRPIPPPTDHEVPDALKDLFEAERKARRQMLLY
jgi:hypothetical protein